MEETFKFDTASYAAYRPLYPKELFTELFCVLTNHETGPFRLADVGCGAGQSSLSLLQASQEIQLNSYDPDPEMCEAAKKVLKDNPVEVGRGEKLPAADKSFHAVTLGNSFHWMDPNLAREEMHRVLEPKGLLFIYKYGFPLPTENEEFSSWFLDTLKSDWLKAMKHPNKEIGLMTEPLVEDGKFLRLFNKYMPMFVNMTADQVYGFLYSTSLFRARLALMSKDESEAYQLKIKNKVQDLLGDKTWECNHKLSAALFQKL